MVLHYDIDEVRPYINWLYFDHAWSMSGKSEADKASLYADANALLDAWQGKSLSGRLRASAFPGQARQGRGVCHDC